MTHLETQIANERYWKIGWAIMHMTGFEKIKWALTGKHRYMTVAFWCSNFAPKEFIEFRRQQNDR